MSFSGLFLRYPSDADKHLLARQTGLSRNQVSNWFINARVRLWKPMVEEMYQQESKEEEGEQEEDDDDDDERESNQNNSGHAAQTPMPIPPSITKPATAMSATGPDNNPSLITINNRQCFSENQAKLSYPYSTTTFATAVTPPTFSTTHESNTCRRGSIVGAECGTTTATSTSANADVGSTLIRFGTTASDVSLTLGLRHAGNQLEKSPFFK